MQARVTHEKTAAYDLVFGKSEGFTDIGEMALKD